MGTLIGVIVVITLIVWFANLKDEKESKQFNDYQSTKKTEEIKDTCYICFNCLTVNRNRKRCKKCGYEFSEEGLIQGKYKNIELQSINHLECLKCSKINSKIRIKCAGCGSYFSYKNFIDNEAVNIDNRILEQIKGNKEFVDTNIVWNNKLCILEIHSSSYGKIQIVTDIIDTMDSYTRLGHNGYGYFIFFTLNKEDIIYIENYIKNNLKQTDSKIDIVCYIPQIGNEKNNLNIEKIFIDKPIRNCTKELLDILERYPGEISLEIQPQKRKTTGYYGAHAGLDYDFETLEINRRHNY